MVIAVKEASAVACLHYARTATKRISDRVRRSGFAKDKGSFNRNFGTRYGASIIGTVYRGKPSDAVIVSMSGYRKEHKEVTQLACGPCGDR